MDLILFMQKIIYDLLCFDYFWFKLIMLGFYKALFDGAKFSSFLNFELFFHYDSLKKAKRPVESPLLLAI